MATPFSSEMMFDIFRTSCSKKPKEYNSEQEVFETRDPSYQENGTHDEDTYTHTHTFQPSFPPYLISMGGRAWISMEMPRLILVWCCFFFFFSLLLRGQNKCGVTSQKSHSLSRSQANQQKLDSWGATEADPPPVLKIQNLSPSLTMTCHVPGSWRSPVQGREGTGALVFHILMTCIHMVQLY